jgi:hypothetical protein
MFIMININKDQYYLEDELEWNRGEKLNSLGL